MVGSKAHSAVAESSYRVAMSEDPTAQVAIEKRQCLRVLHVEIEQESCNSLICDRKRKPAGRE